MEYLERGPNEESCQSYRLAVRVSLKSPCPSGSNAKVNLPPSAESAPTPRNHLYILSSRLGMERIRAGIHEKAKDPPSKNIKSVMKSKSHKVVKWWSVG